ncbi:MAG: glycerate-2-kinase family protein, partial [Planctomycetota bacterium]
MSSPKLTEDALRVWRAGVDAVAADRLVSDALRLTDGGVAVETTRGDVAEAPLAADGRLIVVGGGKAGVGMALGVEAAIAAGSLDPERVSGLVSAPADCVPPPNERRGRRVRIAPGRPAGVNEPRPEGVAAAETMLRLLADARPQDVALVLLSGGGSALLPAPREGVSLGAKRELARTLSAAGATIEELNTVRQHLSRIKGGGLARACRAGRLITLVISDVLGDPLDLIASGPTVTPRSTPADALAVLGRLGLRGDARLDEVVTALERTGDGPPVPPSAEVTHLILANNATAVDAAGAEAERLGYRHAMHCATASEGAAEAIGRDLAAMALRMRDADSPDEPDCLITGGEPTV